MTVPEPMKAAATEVCPCPAALASPGRGTVWWAAALAALTFVVFAPALAAQFLNWDDRGSFLQNEAYRGLGWQNLWWMATTFHMGTYQPVGWFCFGLEYVLFGMNPVGYHLAGVLFHVGAVVVLFFVVRRLLALGAGDAVRSHRAELSLAALVGTLLFALHPLRVEAVVWLSCQTYPICGLFYFLSIHFYLRAQIAARVQGSYRANLGLALVTAALALLARAPAVSLPAVLLVLDVYPLRRVGGAAGWWTSAARGVWREKALFFLLALPIAVVAPFSKQGLMRPLEQHGVAARLAHAAYTLWFFVRKTLLPTRLLPVYEMPPALDPTEGRFVWAMAFVVVVTVALVLTRRRRPELLTTGVCYALMLAPSLGLVQFGWQLTADRYGYLACSVWSVLVGAALAWAWRTRPKRLAPWLTWNGCVLAAFLAVITWRHIGHWQTSEKLWTYAVARDPNGGAAHQGLGTAKLELEQYDAAVAQFREALRIKPDDVEAYYNIGLARRRQGRNADAIDAFVRAVELKPDHASSLYNLGNIFAEQGAGEAAAEVYARAAAAAPTDRDIRNNLGVVLYRLGRWEEAATAFREALHLDPRWVGGYVKLAMALRAAGHLDEARTALAQALALDPDDRGALDELRTLQRSPATSPTGTR
jgi:protein O-mannosyl-transferase